MPAATRLLLVSVLCCAAAGAALAQPAPPAAPDPAAAAATVWTRARYVSQFEEGGRHYVRLKLVPRAKIPFATQTFRLPDPALVAGLAEGGDVKFTARHQDGENTVTALVPAEACRRFQHCD